MLTAFLLLNIASQSLIDDDRFDSYVAHVFASQASLDMGDTALALRWLERSPRELRGWEYDYLLVHSDTSDAEFDLDHNPARIEASPDGKYLATANLDGTVTLYRTAPFAQIGLLEGHANQVWGIAFTPDSKQLVTTSRDTSVKLWDVENREEVGTLGSHPTTPYSVAVSPDGLWAVTPGWQMDPATNGPAGLVSVWDVKGRKLHKQWMVTTHPIAAVAFSPDGKLCAVGCWEYQTIIYRTSDWSMVREIWPEESESYKAVDWLQFSPDGKSILAAHKDQTARLYEVETGRMVAKFSGKGNCTCARFSSDGQEVVTSWTDQNLRVFSLEGSLKRTLRGHTDSVRCFTIVNGDVFSIGEDQVGKRWSPSVARPLVFDAGQECWSAVPSPDGTLIATGGERNLVRVWSSKDGRHVRDLVGFGSLAVDVAWSPDGRRVVGGSNDGSVRVWAVSTGALLHTLRPGGTGQVRGIDWSKDGTFIAAGQGKRLVLWNAAEGTVRHDLEIDHGAYSVSISPDSKRVAAGTGGKVSIIDSQAGKVLHVIEGVNQDVYEIAWSPDGRVLAVTGGNGEITLWSTQDWTKRHMIKDMTLACWALAFSPDGKRLATTAYDQTIRLFDVATGRQVWMVRDLPEIGFDVQWMSDGKRLVHADTNGRVTIYDARPIRYGLGP